MKKPSFRWRHPFRFTLRAALVATLLCATLMAFWVNSARRQRQVVELILKSRGLVAYGHQVDQQGKPIKDARTYIPGWVPDRIGRDFCFSVVQIQLPGKALAELSPRLRDMKHLEHLRIFGRAADQSLAELEHLQTVRSLELVCTGVTDEGFKHVSAMKGLERIRVVGAQLTKTGLQPLRRLPQLRELDLTHCRLCDGDIECLQVASQLRTLRVRNNSVTDAGLEPLQRLTALQELDLRGSKVTATGAASLQQTLPRCTIVR